jgi:hypothetical protein
MDTTRGNALSLIDGYLSRTGTASWSLGLAAVGSAKAISRLRQGSNVTLHTIESLEAFMAANPNGAHVHRPAGRPRPDEAASGD